MNSKDSVETLQADKLIIRIYSDRETMGRQAAVEVSNKLKTLLSKQDNVRMVFAAAPSQNEFLSRLSEINGIDWSRITAFHMDEYIGLTQNAEQLFGNYLNERIFNKINFEKVNYINSNPESLDVECGRYSALIDKAPIDIVCLGIGENGHLAFNDPHSADFDDPRLVKVVELDELCRQQQVNDKCFSLLEDVPERAITLTIPALISAGSLFIVVPGVQKANAVYDTVNGEIKTGLSNRLRSYACYRHLGWHR